MKNVHSSGFGEYEVCGFGCNRRSRGCVCCVSTSFAGAKFPGTFLELVTAKAAFSPRDSADEFLFNGKMWLSNGYGTDGGAIRDLWSSSDGKLWDLVTVNSQNGQTPYDAYSELVVYNEKIWAIKGSVWNSTDGVQWTLVLDKTPFSGLNYADVVVFNQEMWYIGGGSAEVWHSNDGANWMRAPESAPFGARRAADVIVFAGKMWLLGGSTGGQIRPPRSSTQPSGPGTMCGIPRTAFTGSGFSSKPRGCRACGSRPRSTWTGCGFWADSTT